MNKTPRFLENNLSIYKKRIFKIKGIENLSSYDLSSHNPNLSPEKKKLLIEIHEEILRKYREANIPMIFKLPGCSASQWWSYNLNSGEYRKVQISIDDEIACFIYIDEN